MSGVIFKRNLLQAGGSIACPIPSEILKMMNLKQGITMNIEYEDGKIIITAESKGKLLSKPSKKTK